MSFTDMDTIKERPSDGKLFSLAGCITGNPAMAILFDEDNNRFDDLATWEEACSWHCIYAPDETPSDDPENEDTAEKALARHYGQEPTYEDNWTGR